MSEVLIVGGTSGIGWQTALQLAKSGRSVTVVGRKKPLELKSNIRFMPMDVQDEKQVAEVASHFSSVQGLLYSAGIAHPKKEIKDLDLTASQEVFDVNVLGLLRVLKHFDSKLISGSKVVVVSSSAARAFSPFASVEYTASKYALSGIVRQLSQELAARGIQINTIFPSMTMTPMLKKNVSSERVEAIEKQIPLGRVAQPEEVANAIEFLLSDKNTYMTGCGLDLNGGLFPNG